jgi:hypothetical protein
MADIACVSVHFVAFGNGLRAYGREFRKGGASLLAVGLAGLI